MDPEKIKSVDAAKGTWLTWRWTLVSVAAFAMYLLVVDLLYKSPRAECETGGRPTQTACLSANEIGDAIAGIFSPLAFLAAVAALLLQTRELAAQRREIAQNSEFNRRQTDIFNAELASGLHREFVELIPERTKVWQDFADPKRTVKGDDKEFWRIAAFFQRLTFLIERGYLDPIEAGEFMHHNAAWWHMHFFTHPRCGDRDQCPEAEMKPARQAWELIEKAHINSKDSKLMQKVDLWLEDAKRSSLAQNDGQPNTPA